MASQTLQARAIATPTSPARSSTTLSLFLCCCCAAWSTTVGTASFVSATRPSTRSALTPEPTTILTGLNICRCCREMLIWRAMLISTACFSALLLSSPSSCAAVVVAAVSRDGGRVICVCTDDTTDEADDMDRLVMELPDPPLDEPDDEGAAAGAAATICHWGSGIAGLRGNVCPPVVLVSVMA